MMVTFQAGLVEVCCYAVLFLIGLIVNQATVFLVKLVLELAKPMEGDLTKPTQHGLPECTYGVFGMSKILGVVALFVTACYAYRVLSGHVHSDGIYILGAALVQEEKILKWVSVERLVAIVRVCTLSLVVPFTVLGLEVEHMQETQTLLHSASKRGSWDENQDNQKEMEKIHRMIAHGNARRTEIKKGDPGRGRDLGQGFVSLIRESLKNIRRKFAARSAMTRALLDLAYEESDDVDVKSRMKLYRSSGKSDLRLKDFRLYEFTHCYRKMGNQRNCKHTLSAMLGSPFGKMNSNDAVAHRMAERCSIWQAQAESVHKATCYTVSIVLMLVPIGGAVAGKGLQLLSDVPAFFSAHGDVVKEICEYSFFQDSDVANDPDLKEPTIQPSLWCRIAYVIALGRVAFSILVITQLSPEDERLFWISSLTASGLHCFQAQLQKLADSENKCNVARRAIELKKAPKKPIPKATFKKALDRKSVV